LNCKGTKYSEYTWTSGGTTTEESSFTPSISGNAEGFKLDGTKVTVSANSSYTSTRSVTYTASYSGAEPKSVTIT
jgi:hypothetical protein